MKTTGFLAGASRFAHLAGLARASRRASEDDDQQARRAEEDDEEEPKGKRSRASDDDADDEPKGKRSRASDDDEDGDDEPKGKRSRASDDDDGDDEPKGRRSRASDGDDDEPKGKRGRRAEDDDDDKGAEDDDEDEMKGKGANASARRREQARIAHILGHKAAASNLPLAVSLACDTRMTRREAVAVLQGQADAGGDRDDAPRGRHARRDRQDRNPELGSDREAPRGQQAVSASWDRAFGKAGISTTPKG